MILNVIESQKNNLKYVSVNNKNLYTWRKGKEISWLVKMWIGGFQMIFYVMEEQRDKITNTVQRM